MGLASIPAVPCQSGADRRRRPATRSSRIAAKPSRARKMRAPAPPARASTERSLREVSGGVSATACGFAGGVNGAFEPPYESKRAAFGLRGNAFQSSCGGAARLGSPGAADATGATIATKTTQANANRNEQASEFKGVRKTMCLCARFLWLQDSNSHSHLSRTPCRSSKPPGERREKLSVHAARATNFL